MLEDAEARKAALDRIRFEIDSIDDEICDLLDRRFSAVASVRAAKENNTVSSPIRPGREFAVLKRLASRPDRYVPPALKVRLWRTIMSAATVSQAPVEINVGPSIGSSVPLRVLIESNFGSLPVRVHESDAQALAQIVADPVSLCFVEPASNWARHFLDGRLGETRVIGCLPVVGAPRVPCVLILGHGVSETTGHDETILIGSSKAPGITPAWQVNAGDCVVTSVSGFYLDLSSLPGGFSYPESMKIAGHFSRLPEDCHDLR